MSKVPNQPPSFAALVQAYFAEYLTQQRALSPQTVAAYRDAFVPSSSHNGKLPVAIALSQS
jgi:integrase/recombinase XerC